MNNPNTPTPTILETERLHLRLLSPEVYRHVMTTTSDQKIKAYFGFKTEEELETEKENFRKGVETYYFTFANFFLLDKQNGEVLGRCGFHTWIPKHRRAEVGYHLINKEDRGKGLMTEALAPILAYGFEKMNLYRVEALLADSNVPSRKLLQRFGFKEEGTVRGHYVVNGVNEDSLLVSLLQPEYTKLKPTWGLQQV